MTYTEADAMLQGRCKNSRKLENNTYLKRRGVGAIAVRLHSTDIITLYADGSLRICMGGWNTMTTKDRLNGFLPHPWRVWSHTRKYGAGHVVIGERWNERVVFDSHDVILVSPEGEITGGHGPAEIEREYRAEVNAQRRARYKERYWILKARRGGKSTKPLTLDIIQAEENISTRTAMIKVYGLERFLVDVGAKVADQRGDYALICYPLNARSNITALKMVCPSTKTVYIHPVDPMCETVDQALDWMFQTENYSERLLAEA